MPANLTPQYSKAEEKFRKAQSTEERVACLEEMLQLIPKHKGTEKLQADLKTKLKEAKEERAAEAKAPKKAGKSYKVPRQGAGQVVLVGAPNAGKSNVLAHLTNAKPEVAPYPFTTREPMPGMMPWQDVTVQLVDMPPIGAGNIEPYQVSAVRCADAVVLCFDGSSDDAPDETAEVLRLLAERKTVLADESGFADDDYSTVRVKTLLVPTHAADDGWKDRVEFFREMTGCRLSVLPTELENPPDVENLRNAIYGMLDLIRVYTKVPGKPADRSSPFALPAGSTVEDLAAKVHRDLAASLKFAKVWGEGLHDGQSVGIDQVLKEGNMVELHTG